MCWLAQLMKWVHSFHSWGMTLKLKQCATMMKNNTSDGMWLPNTLNSERTLSISKIHGWGENWKNPVQKFGSYKIPLELRNMDVSLTIKVINSIKNW
jgi:hypothetical protein